LFFEKFKGNKGLLKRLECARDENGKTIYGILRCQVAKRRTYYGSNKLPDKEIKSIINRLQETAKDPILKILFLAAIVSFLLSVMVRLHMYGEDEMNNHSGVSEGATIFMTLVIVSFIEAITTRKVEQEIQTAKNKLNQRSVIVHRDLVPRKT